MYLYSTTWLQLGIWSLLPLLLPAALAQHNDALNQNFSSPSPQTRLKFRYWLPDASVNPSTVANDIKSSGALGAGGIEFLPLYNYGASLAPPPRGADWATYGFGTPAFNRVFKEAIKAARDADMVFDFALGPNQGQGIPANVNDGEEELHWDLALFNATVPANGSYNGKIPGWGTTGGNLVALVSAEVLTSSTIQNPASETFSTPSTNSTRLVLRSSSLTDQNSSHTNAVPEYRLFAYYEYQDLVKNLDIQTNTTGTIFDNGSYTVDHFSLRGAQTTIDFWERYILNDTETRGLLAAVGRYAWKDSLEIKSNISWSPSLPIQFRKQHGYDLRRYLPLIAFGNNNPSVQPSYQGDLLCVLDTHDAGAGIVNTESLGLQYSSQVSYNLPLDMESSIPSVPVPECESLAFNNSIDGYRQFSGPAHLSDKKVISNEMGGDLRKGFRLTVPTLLWQINSAFAGGVNMIVLHGQTYSGNYYDTTWPGYTVFFMLFSDSYNDKQPARVQGVLHAGVQKADVVFYNKASVTDPQLSTVYRGSDLVRGGYTYSYLSPANLNLSSARVQGGLMAPEGPRYQALVVTSEQNVTLDAVRKIQCFADDGLHVLLAGGMPGYFPSGTGRTEEGDRAAVSSALQTLQNARNVYIVDGHEIASTLEALNLLPRVAVQTNGTWYPVYRTDNETRTDYIFLFSNPASATSTSKSTGSITVQTTKTPYVFNAWSGHRAPVLHYHIDKDNGTTTIPVTLAANQTVIFAFSNDLASEIDTPSTSAVHLPGGVLGYNYTAATGLALHVSTSTSPSTSSQDEDRTGTRTVHFANGGTHALPTLNANNITQMSEFTLSDWTLKAEHWMASTNFSAAHIAARKYNTTHPLTQYGDSIPSWLEIQGLRNVSGVCYYSSFFEWPATTVSNMTSEPGAYISLPSTSHGVQVYINGHRVSGIDFAHPVADIGPFLGQGTNEVEVVVPTVMWKYIRSLYGSIEIAGSDPLLGTTGALLDRVETGLVGVIGIVSTSPEDDVMKIY
ncbi:uncharacterized protein BDV17DRAFT_284052 [Aspergillus undulatus]|uniref:uncharacterized protein n=1 Tax=Aspergillus undulatus TaxID=1810928 RepID=UPI003CCCED32